MDVYTVLLFVLFSFVRSVTNDETTVYVVYDVHHGTFRVSNTSAPQWAAGRPDRVDFSSRSLTSQSIDLCI